MKLEKLSFSQYNLVRPLFEGIHYNLAIHSVVEGNTPAWVFADDPADPRAAVLWDRQDAIFLAGSPADQKLPSAVRDVLMRHILPDARARWIPQMELFYTPEEWSSTAPDLLPELPGENAQRIDFRFTRLPEGWRNQLPEGFTLRRIDHSLLESDLDHLDEVRGWINSFWHTPLDFQRVGCGYCAITGATVAAWCLTVFAAGLEREVGLETVAQYRGMGLAALVSAATIDTILQNGWTPRWQCHFDNPPSAVVARKVGFLPDRQYTVYRFRTQPQ